MWIIVDIAHAEWKRALDGSVISKGKEPTFIHDSKERAEAELLRLAALDPFGEFVLFEATERALPTRSRSDVFLVVPMPS
jgi:hypothetical protein